MMKNLQKRLDRYFLMSYIFDNYFDVFDPLPTMLVIIDGHINGVLQVDFKVKHHCSHSRFGARSGWPKLAFELKMPYLKI